MRTGRSVCVFAALLLVVPAAAAEGQTQERDVVPLYTNADLAKFGPPSPAPERDPEREARSRMEEWERVQGFLDREHARIDAERGFERESRWREEARDLEEQAAGVWSYSGLWPDFFPGRGAWRPGRHHDPGPGYRVLPHSLGGRIVQGGHGRYSHMKGSDAFPGATRSRPGRPQPLHQRPH